MGNCDLAHQPLKLLPEYEATQRSLIDRGHPAEWVLRIVDPSDPHSTFLKNGGHWYKSNCPSYEGYWLSGCTGSAQCKTAPGLLPGIHHHCFCASEEGISKCPYRPDAQDQ